MTRGFTLNTCLQLLVALTFCTLPTAVQADLVIGTSAFDLPNVPDLLYTPATGNVQIDADGAEILSFQWESNPGQFIPPADFSDLDSDVGSGMSTFIDNETTAIGWASVRILENIGFNGPAIADLGNIFPTGLDEAGLESLLVDREDEWSGPRGSFTGGMFDLVVVPELSAFVYLLVSSTGLVLASSCRRLWRSIFRP